MVVPIDPRTGLQVDTLPSMDTDGHIPTRAELRDLSRSLRKRIKMLGSLPELVHPPHPQSLLADVDLEGFARESPSVVIRNALTASAAHLDAAHAFPDLRGANRITCWSLLRPALMSATVAGWVIAGNESRECARRAAIVVAESLGYELQHVANLARIAGRQTEERLEWLVRRKADLNAWAADGGYTLGRRKINMTEAIKEVAEAVGLEELGLDADWNAMSSGAHGFGWHIQGRTFGKGTASIPSSRFVAFPIKLDRADYLWALDRVTTYAERVGNRVPRWATAPD